MIELAKSDIFFLITGGSVLVVTVVVLVAMYYIVKILRDVEEITDSVNNEGKNIIYDVSYIRRALEKGAKKVKKIIRPSSHKKTKKKK